MTEIYIYIYSKYEVPILASFDDINHTWPGQFLLSGQ